MRTVRIAALAIICGVVLLALVIGYRTYTERYTVQTEGRDGLAVARVVQATMTRASDLKVSTLRGTVQSVASDSRGFGLVNSNRVMKAPFKVAYFVDMSGVTPGDFVWNEQLKTLTVNAPGLRLGKVNVDESRTYIDRTTGVFVTRDAMAKMQRQASAGAERVAAQEARKPERLAAAQRNARLALSALFGGPLAAAGLGEVTVEIVFPGENLARGQQWDTSRSLEEVFANS